MKKNKFITSAIILMIGSIITKLINMVIRIGISRTIGTTGMGVYMLVVPTFSLFISLSQMGLPVAISKLVSEKKSNNRNLVFSATFTIMAFNLILLTAIFLSANLIANKLLHDYRTYQAIKSMALVLPFISISSILRGYYFGKQKMIPHVCSNVIEDIVRMIVIFIGLPISYNYGIEYAISFIILSNIVSETVSIMILLMFAPKKMQIKKSDIKPDYNNIKNIFKIGVPTTGSRLISSLGACLEPILLTSVLLTNGYSNNFIVTDYGVIPGHILPILVMPSFFTSAISSSLIPVISEAYVNQKYAYVKNKLKQAILLSLACGIPFTIFLIIFSNQSLSFLYNTTVGNNYLKIVAPFFLTYYIQTPLSAFLQAIGKSTHAMIDNLIGISLKLLIIFILGYFNIGLFNLIIALVTNIIIVTLLHYLNIKKSLNFA